jgi:hypothetical protein
VDQVPAQPGYAAVQEHAPDDQERPVEDERVLLERGRLVRADLHDRRADGGAVDAGRAAQD